MKHHDNITLREYYIAHAPAKPQPWFKPDFGNAPIESNSGHFYVDVHAARKGAANGESFSKHEAKVRKARYTQWPAAWADEMVKHSEGLSTEESPRECQLQPLKREGGRYHEDPKYNRIMVGSPVMTRGGVEDGTTVPPMVAIVTRLKNEAAGSRTWWIRRTDGVEVWFYENNLTLLAPTK